MLLGSGPGTASIEPHADRLGEPAVAALGQCASPPDTDTEDVARRLHWATTHLLEFHPSLSAANPAPLWQKLLAALALSLAIAMGFASPASGIVAAMVAALLLLPFACVTALRLTALRFALREQTPSGGGRVRTTLQSLPRYTVLVPLFRETAVIRDLVRALSRIEYPYEKLEIFLVIESYDRPMQKALQSISLPSNMRVIVVPDVGPRTKPKALNFALTYANGELVVVYDAEDEPDANQLQRAAAMFGEQPDLACVQAELNVYNDKETWLTRQFALEYKALFAYLLPTLERIGFPIPLGGTSNHFRREILERVGGWDPFNVTEDADLGMRLARQGYKVATLSSTTMEEAPPTLRIWLGQRTRWLKGWMQTWLVHMREPRRTLNDLGRWQLVGLNVLLAAQLLSAFAHPWAYVLLARAATQPASPGETLSALDVIFWLGVSNLALAYTAAARLAIVASGQPARTLALDLLLLPFYWLLISVAAYRALIELLRKPFYWEKTVHRARSTSTSEPE